MHSCHVRTYIYQYACIYTCTVVHVNIYLYMCAWMIVYCDVPVYVHACRVVVEYTGVLHCYLLGMYISYCCCIYYYAHYIYQYFMCNVHHILIQI